MKKTFNTADGLITVDTNTVTDEEWLALNLNLDELKAIRALETLVGEVNDAHTEIEQLLSNWSRLNHGERIQAVVDNFPNLLKFYLAAGVKLGFFKLTTQS